ncbi:WavE lipopolysaccharide synthesis [Pseudomonas syringae]|nr:WavE lipopolysaccharide synthesis [Pseudomonas syringae]MBD8577444.1 WavE lipopolysaccharide synthesis [Pseudomonas syringae]MBD8792841.1 WavE lipopolysaccharide synthesis [Pseudomonas syringae]MBD8803538.1 WavE lipopolysaccharide synthesis [Pseudomonas syringae]MBD8814177.1 WavE lipopolysaccharide synthesis [Pseudomonas syringae]
MHALGAIDSKSISVVIQGPLYRASGPERSILTCIASIRRHLPCAEIIVSTWRDEDITEIDADGIVLLDDPGGLFDCSGNQINTNRMLHSTAKGIQAANRPYVMKLRADHRLTSAALAVIGRPIADDGQASRLFNTPITITTLYIRNPERVPMLFHLSDLVQFGTREAMLDLWQQPLIQQQDLLNDKPFRNPFGHFTGYSSARRVPEQAILLGAMRKKGIKVHLANPSQVTMSHLKLWDRVLRCNFRVLDYTEAGVAFPERFLSNGFSLKSLYTAAEIEQLGEIGPMAYRRRMASILLNKYVLSCFRPVWWLSMASIVLFNLSPRLARNMRSHWRKARKLVHADSYRV